MSTAVDNTTTDNQVTTVPTTEATNGTAPAAQSTVDAAAVSADEGRRLYIGNLAYATTEGELKEFFKSYTM
jgi:RNA recognition motif-containing protein